jgi:hypothetical protein
VKHTDIYELGCLQLDSLCFCTFYDLALLLSWIVSHLALQSLLHLNIVQAKVSFSISQTKSTSTLIAGPIRYRRINDSYLGRCPQVKQFDCVLGCISLTIQGNVKGGYSLSPPTL